MNIAVYCGAAKGKDKAYEEAAITVGKWIVENGHTLVYGGGNVGLMGVLANTVLELGGKVIGVIPDILFIREQRHDGITEIIDTHSMSERRNKMIELSDAFIALPGGPGTLDEISEIIMFIRIQEINKPCVLYDTKGFYQPLRDLLLLMEKEGFMEKSDLDKLLFSEKMDEVADYISKF